MKFKMNIISCINKNAINMSRKKYEIILYKSFLNINVFYEIWDIAIERLDNMKNGSLNLTCMELTSLDWMKGHPKFNDIVEIYCDSNKIINLPSPEGPVPGWPNIKRVLCTHNLLKNYPYGPLLSLFIVIIIIL